MRKKAQVTTFVPFSLRFTPGEHELITKSAGKALNPSLNRFMIDSALERISRESDGCFVCPVVKNLIKNGTIDKK